jgi:hypothetical protein
LHDQHTLGDHQAFTARQIGTAVDAVEIAEIVEAGVGRIFDIEYVRQFRSLRRRWPA